MERDIEELRKTLHIQVDKLIDWLHKGEREGYPNGHYGMNDGYEPIHTVESRSGQGLLRYAVMVKKVDRDYIPDIPFHKQPDYKVGDYL